MSTQPMRARLDPLRFQQVVRNVLGNALKVSPAGATVEVGVGTSTSGGAVQREGGGSVFEIRLPGGIPDTQPAELA